MKYNRSVKFNTNPITSSRPLRKLGRNLFFSLGVPVVFTLIALILSSLAGNKMFLIPGDALGSFKNIMTFVKARAASNTNTGSHRVGHD